MQIHPKKALGQHFLRDPAYCKRIVRLAELNEEDTVLEIGPGTGELTRFLLESARTVIAIELDGELIEHLARRWPDRAGGRLQLLQGDILHFDWSRLPDLRPPVKLVANLPYNIATRTLTKMSERAAWFQSLTVMVQREVAERILAAPGGKDFGYFTLLMEYHFERERGFRVPPGAFQPPPKVWSEVLRLVPRSRPPVEADYRRLVKLLKCAFRQRRKTLFNNLRSVSRPGAVREALDRCAIEVSRRPQGVSLAEYACLARML